MACDGKVLVWASGTGWDTWTALVASVDAYLLLLCAQNLLRRHCCVDLHPKWNQRDACLLVTMAAISLRLLWLVDPQGFRCWFDGPVLRVVLLRVPQILTVVGFLIVCLTWLSVMNAVRPDEVLVRRVRRGAMAAVVVLAGVDLPATVLLVLGVDPPLTRAISKGCFSVYALMLASYAAWQACLITSILAGHEQRAAGGGGTLRRTLRNALRNLRTTVLSASVMVALLVSATSTILIADINPQTDPERYLWYFYVIYGLVEPGFWSVLLYSSYQKPLRECCRYNLRFMRAFPLRLPLQGVEGIGPAVPPDALRLPARVGVGVGRRGSRHEHASLLSSRGGAAGTAPASRGSSGARAVAGTRGSIRLPASKDGTATTTSTTVVTGGRGAGAAAAAAAAAAGTAAAGRSAGLGGGGGGAAALGAAIRTYSAEGGYGGVTGGGGGGLGLEHLEEGTPLPSLAAAGVGALHSTGGAGTGADEERGYGYGSVTASASCTSASVDGTSTSTTRSEGTEEL